MKTAFSSAIWTLGSSFVLSGSSAAVASSLSITPTWVIGSGATDHLIGVHSHFQSSTPSFCWNVRIDKSDLSQVAREGSVTLLPELSSFLILKISFYG